MQNSFSSFFSRTKPTSSWGGVRKLPFAFTEQGIYMLMTVLKGDLATRQSMALIRFSSRWRTISSQKISSWLGMQEFLKSLCKPLRIQGFSRNIPSTSRLSPAKFTICTNILEKSIWAYKKSWKTSPIPLLTSISWFLTGRNWKPIPSIPLYVFGLQIAKRKVVSLRGISIKYEDREQRQSLLWHCRGQVFWLVEQRRRKQSHDYHANRAPRSLSRANGFFMCGGDLGTK